MKKTVATILVAFSLFSLTASLAGGGEKVIKGIDRTRIIRSHEKPHDVIKKACYACHPGEKFDFWMLIYEGKEPKLTVEEKPKPFGVAAKGVRQGEGMNSHENLACNFCHYDNPEKGKPRFIVDPENLCRICHPQTTNHHIPKDEKVSKFVRNLISKGKLPGSGGDFNCYTCHTIHDSPLSMSDDYRKALEASKIQNPHGNKVMCATCHAGKIKKGGEVRFVSGRNIDKLCLSCHGKEGVPSSPHVWGVRSTEKTWKMDYLGFPLLRGKLTCQTCHDEVCYDEIDPDNPKFLRGGPYRDIDDFCYKCHINTNVAFSSPHRQIDQFGRIVEESCLFCHTGVPTGDPNHPGTELVGSEVSVCGSCHDIYPHPGVNHLIKLPDDMYKRKVEYEKRHDVKVPLGDGRTIQCSTCHNPHGKGVIKGEAGVGAGSKWRVGDFKEVCAPCHGRY
ncbi:MAG: hypothetical protein D6713_06260 [Deltaproteobacteria bacterium]|nr:MAG: hypothetical protein D6713_06260 [Deltaproteobacteria bacterium]